MKKYFKILKFLLKAGLVIFLALSFYNRDVEPAFWIMSISLVLVGILIANSQKINLKKFLKTLLYLQYY